jgi:hemerythrin-like domain-containing protein
MAVLDRLGQEHSKVLRELGLLGVTLQKIETKGVERLKTLDLEAVSRILRKDIPDHFGLEEMVLFPRLKQLAPDEKSFLEELLSEHEKIRKQIDVFLRDASSAGVQPDKAAGSLAKVVEDLSSHARKEDERLLPLARRVLTEAELEELDKALAG